MREHSIREDMYLTGATWQVGQTGEVRRVRRAEHSAIGLLDGDSGGRGPQILHVLRGTQWGDVATAATVGDGDIIGGRE